MQMCTVKPQSTSVNLNTQGTKKYVRIRECSSCISKSLSSNDFMLGRYQIISSNCRHNFASEDQKMFELAKRSN